MSHCYLRKAEAGDRRLLYEWINDSEVRKNSFHSEKISWEEHINWFQKKLSSDECDIYLYCVDEIPVGQIRLEYQKDRANISYSIEKQFRGQGHGRAMLSLAEQITAFERKNIAYLDAEVKKFNIASRKKFEQLGYTCIEVMKYSKKIENVDCEQIAATKERNTGGGV